jgi:hypothetical protein
MNVSRFWTAEGGDFIFTPAASYSVSYDPTTIFRPLHSQGIGRFQKNEKGEVVPMLINPAIKVIVMNQAWPGINYLGLDKTPIVIAGEDHADKWKADHCNPYITDTAKTAPDFNKAMEMAYEIYKTDKIIVFDGNFGHINCSRSMAQLLMEKAPGLSLNVDEELLPMWLRQRGLDMKEYESTT